MEATESEAMVPTRREETHGTSSFQFYLNLGHRVTAWFFPRLCF